MALHWTYSMLSVFIDLRPTDALSRFCLTSMSTDNGLHLFTNYTYVSTAQDALAHSWLTSILYPSGIPVPFQTGSPARQTPAWIRVRGQLVPHAGLGMCPCWKSCWPIPPSFKMSTSIQIFIPREKTLEIHPMEHILIDFCLSELSQ